MEIAIVIALAILACCACIYKIRANTRVMHNSMYAYQLGKGMAIREYSARDIYEKSLEMKSLGDEVFLAFNRGVEAGKNTVAAEKSNMDDYLRSFRRRA